MQWTRTETPRFQRLSLTGAVLILTSLWYRPNAGAILIEVSADRHRDHGIVWTLAQTMGRVGLFPLLVGNAAEPQAELR